MKLFGKHKYDNLDEAILYADKCTFLRLFVADNLADKGQDFCKLQRLTELFIQGDPAIYQDYTIKLPVEIGQLKRLQKLTLLNLPLEVFPEWILNLSSLNYLMVRGTDITSIPDNIQQLSKIKTLRIENCSLQTLPTAISQMYQLKYLGLCDTRVKEIKSSMFPPNLTQLDFSGTGSYNISDLQQLKSELNQTCIYPDV